MQSELEYCVSLKMFCSDECSDSRNVSDNKKNIAGFC